MSHIHFMTIYHPKMATPKGCRCRQLIFRVVGCQLIFRVSRWLQLLSPNLKSPRGPRLMGNSNLLPGHVHHEIPVLCGSYHLPQVKLPLSRMKTAFEDGSIPMFDSKKQCEITIFTAHSSYFFMVTSAFENGKIRCFDGK